MRVKLLETVHETWATKGMIGELTQEAQGKRFYPDEVASDFPWDKPGIWIGGAKFEPIGHKIEEPDSTPAP